MNRQMIEAEPLTKEAFAPFGEVIETDGAHHFAINEGTTQRFHDLGRIDTGTEGGHTIVNIFRGQPFVAPVEIKMFERHPLGSQLFMPLDGRPFFVVVAEADGDGDPVNPRGFVARGHQGVNYGRGVWHHPLLSLEAQSDFLVVDRGGEGDNLEEHALQRPFLLGLPS